MKKDLSIVLLFIIGLVSSGMGQRKAYTAPSKELLSNNKEEVFIHYNSSFLLAGESLYYKFYSLDAASGRLKDLSKTGYLELTGEDGPNVFYHKVKLEKGQGYGDFLIPSTIPSGTYKLTGYTRWMLNAGKEHYFTGDLVIINPYMEDQSRLLQVNDSLGENETKTWLEDASPGRNEEGQKLFNLTVNKKHFGKRERVQLEINRKGNDVSKGNFSLSVKKIEEFDIPQVSVATAYRNAYRQPGREELKEVVLPDLRGQIVEGEIIPREQAVAASGKSVIFSLPGDPFFTRIVKTAADGSFIFNLGNRNFGSTAFLQVLGEEKHKFDIILEGAPGINKTALSFEKFKVTPKMVEDIGRRSIFIQVENSFTAVKQDSILPEEPATPFYGTLPEMYVLDDFTRFPTLQETFVEIIPLARIRKDRQGLSRFELITGTGSQDLKPLLLVDGMVVQDHEDFVHYDARKIKSIGLQREKYYLGPEIFEGIIAVETATGDFFTSLNRNFISSIDIQNLQPEKEYFSPVYTGRETRLSRVPDYRLQLLWLPMLEMDSPLKEIGFFTSDVRGNYEIVLQGFTGDGEPVYLREVILVE